MDTNFLNQYKFSLLIEEQAQKVRRARLDAQPNSAKELTTEDFKQGFENLQWYRENAMKLLDKN